MSVLLICNVRVHAPETYRQYTAQTPAIIEKYGGRFIARGGPTETLEGPEFTNRMAIIEFASADDARAFYNSPEYRSARAIRADASEASFVLIERTCMEDAVRDAQVVASG